MPLMKVIAHGNYFYQTWIIEFAKRLITGLALGIVFWTLFAYLTANLFFIGSRLYSWY